MEVRIRKEDVCLPPSYSHAALPLAATEHCSTRALLHALPNESLSSLAPGGPPPLTDVARDRTLEVPQLRRCAGKLAGPVCSAPGSVAPAPVRYWEAAASKTRCIPALEDLERGRRRHRPRCCDVDERDGGSCGADVGQLAHSATRANAPSEAWGCSPDGARPRPSVYQLAVTLPGAGAPTAHAATMGCWQVGRALRRRG